MDAHHHLWEYNPDEFDWINDDMVVLKNDFSNTDLEKELNACAITGSVVVQARQSEEETRWLLEQASANDFIKGVVGWLDLQATDIDEKLTRYSKHTKLKGLRHIVQAETDDRFMMRDEFCRGIACLHKYGFTYDLLIYPRHLLVACELVAQFPRTRFVLDHLAKPSIKEGVREPWNTEIRRLAAYPNVSCKLSGIVSVGSFAEWKHDDFTFYLETVYEVFGEDRLMFGSDWPVCLVNASYPQIVQLTTDFLRDKGKLAQEKIMRLNAIRFYNLEIEETRQIAVRKTHQIRF